MSSEDPPAVPAAMSRMRSANDIVQQLGASRAWRVRMDQDLARNVNRPLVYLAEIIVTDERSGVSTHQLIGPQPIGTGAERAALYEAVPELQARLEDLARKEPIILAAQFSYPDNSSLKMVTDFEQ